ncbi:hypothetical protein V1389_08580 [Flavobacterium rakeshii]|uniref:hypothetical protein n=1 Tax=Flavobacterium rakeshii TaxID=1038845 RepID=UPI002E7C566B|nr:hypothetical protein [Flavobacterium rakeshii]MEE1898388.1 hypothetical protein [Flavobacterium rakeshii]
MKHILTLCFLLTLNCLSAQDFAYIQDNDGYCNVRNSADINKIETRLKNGSIVSCFFDKNNATEKWIPVDYTDAEGKIADGVVYRDRLVVINETNFKKITATKINDSSAKISFDTVSIVIRTENFNPKGKTFTYFKEYPNMIEFINGKPYYGTDGEMPTTQYASIEVTMENKTIKLPAQALENLYEPNLKHTWAYYDSKNDTIFIEAFNSDGAGGYMVMWKIEKGIYKEKALFYGF